MTDFGLFLLMFAAIVALVALIKALSWLESVRERGWSTLWSVKRYDAAVMSRSLSEATTEVTSSLQTRPQTDQDQTDDPKERRARMLDTYKALRKHGFSRADARDLLKPWGIPLDNNLWADAAPEEPPTVTPIAGRPTAAKFHEDDPELEYQPPPG